MPKDVVGSVLVVGGGIAGMQSALDLADSGDGTGEGAGEDARDSR